MVEENGMKIPTPSFTRCVSLLAAVLLLSGCGSREPEEVKGGEGSLYFYRLGVQKQNEGDFESSISMYEKALHVNPKLAEAHLDIGIIYDDYRIDREKAIYHYKEFQRLEPGSGKAEMVGRWIQRAEKVKDEQVGLRTQGGFGESSEADEIQRELERARGDIENMRVENEAYLKTVAALREDLTQAKRELERLLGGKARVSGGKGEVSVSEREMASLARSLETEKMQLWERHRREKGVFEKALRELKSQLKNLQTKKKESDRALNKSKTELKILKRLTPGPKSVLEPSDEMKKKLSGSRERNTLLERKCRLYMKDNKALSAKLKETEKTLEEWRARALSKKAVPQTPERAQAPPASPHLVAKLKAEEEKAKQEIRQSYEKRLLEMRSALERQKGDNEKKTAEAGREVTRMKEKVDKYRQASERAERDQRETVGKLMEQFAKEKAEIERRFHREKEILLSKLSEARRKKGPVEAPSPPGQTLVRRVARSAAKKTPLPVRRIIPAPAPARRYRVARGDTLSSIAVRFYGNAAYFKKVFDANRDTLDSPRSLREGQILIIP